jgi:histidyl-tRNA synthetase
MTGKPSIPKGTRDFAPLEMTRRNFIFDTTRKIFTTYGYLPIETPAMENLSSLLGKYGDEGDKLLFRILNSGDFRKGLSRGELVSEPAGKLGNMISEKGLRYDLTVPFARYVVQHRGEILFPFKRYQIQPVWRADRPQRGRYREFYQCDVDVIGSNSLLNEFELVCIMDEVFGALGLETVIRINNRKVLAGVVEMMGEKERMADITVSVDKLEKVGMKGVMEELRRKKVEPASLEKLEPVLTMKGSSTEKLEFLKKRLTGSVAGMEGVDEVDRLLGYLEAHPARAAVEFDMTLARGLDYYTGTIFEVVSTEVEMGSICGGGRYDDLTGIFGLEGVSGVGVSFGAERIYDVMEQLGRFPDRAAMDTRVLFVNFGEAESKRLFPVISRLRKEGIPSELYPDPVKMKKQMGYANSRQIPFVALMGEEEIREGVVTLKDMASGEQERLTPAQLVKRLSVQ